MYDMRHVLRPFITKGDNWGGGGGGVGGYDHHDQHNMHNLSHFITKLITFRIFLQVYNI